ALQNQDMFTKMEQMREQALDEFGLEGTPTFYINGKQLTGDKTLEEMAAAIDPLVPADFQPTQPAEAAPAEAPAADAPAMDAPAADAPAMDAPAAAPATEAPATSPAPATSTPATPAPAPN